MHAVTVPHPHFHSTPTAAPEELYGVPVLADQVDFEPQPQTPTTRDKTPYLKRIFSKDSKKAGSRRVPPPTAYPSELVGMTMDERQDLAEQGRRGSQDPMQIDNHPAPQRSHKSKKSVTWHPDLGSTSSSSGHAADNAPSCEESASIASDKTIWPFPRKPSSLSEKRLQSQSPATSESHDTTSPTTADDPPFAGFEFTPRTYVPLWSPSSEADELPTTPEPSPSRHRRTSSISHRFSKSSASKALAPHQHSRSRSSRPLHSEDRASHRRGLPPFGGAKVYTPPSPFEHSIAGFSEQKGYQAGVGQAAGEWKRADFGEGQVEGSPSRTLQYAAADWLRTR